MRFCAPLCLLCLFAIVTTHHFFGFGVTAAADAVVGRKEDFDASLDVVFNGETVEVPTVKKSSSAYDSYEKKSAKCEDCVSFLREMSDRVRSKRFRERAYKVVDEMCECTCARRRRQHEEEDFGAAAAQSSGRWKMRRDERRVARASASRLAHFSRLGFLLPLPRRQCGRRRGRQRKRRRNDQCRRRPLRRRCVRFANTAPRSLRRR